MAEENTQSVESTVREIRCKTRKKYSAEEKLRIVLEELLINLGKEQNDLTAHIRHATMTDDQLACIEEFCAKIRTGLDHADFNARRQIIKLLDIRGKIAFENGQKVLYLKCLINTQEQQQRLPIQISHSSSSDWQNSIELTVRFVLMAKSLPSCATN